MKQFTEGLFRGPRGGDYSRFSTVIDLQYSDRDVLGELRIVPNFYWVADIALFPPDHKRVQYTLRLLEKAPLPIYIHCEKGVDRTGFMVASYRIHVQGWSKWRAICEMIKEGMHPWFYWWAFFL
jgi:hypothetical protein